MRWLTATELAIELSVDVSVVETLHKQGKIKGIGTGKNARYLDPGPELAREAQGRRLEYFSMITSRELAEILGIVPSQVRKLAALGQIVPTEIQPNGRGTRAFYNVAELRRVLAEREKRSGPGRKTYSSVLVKWVRGWLATRQSPVQVLDELIHQVASKVPDPEKTVMIKELWDLFDRVNDLMAMCDRYELSPSSPRSSPALECPAVPTQTEAEIPEDRS
jgi:hypothetical protein